MQTTRGYAYTLEKQEDGGYVVFDIGLGGPYSFVVTDTPLFVQEDGFLSEEPDPLDDLEVLGDRPTDMAQLSGDLTGGDLPYYGQVDARAAEGESSPALVLGLLGEDAEGNPLGGLLLLSEKPYADGTVVTVLQPVPGEGGANQFVLDEEGVTCFAAGTRILTARGEVAVEALRAGERVVTLSGRGAVLKPVVWIGRRGVDVARHRAPHRVRPVRIRAGALGEGVPHRDLVVSPEHALRLDGALVHAKTLVNGATVVQEDRAAVVYFHLDLGCHEVVLAEGAPAESYLNEDGRAGFDNAASAGVVALRAGDAAAVPAYAPCAPFLREGPALLAILAGVMGRAEALGWGRSEEHGLHLRADGRVIRGEAAGGGVHRFAVPAGTGVLEVVSRAGRPLGTVPGRTDGRWLGVQLGGLGFEGPGRGAVEVPLDHPGLARGFSHLETRGGVARRWTTGVADLSAALGEGLATGGVLTLRVTGTPGYWVREAPGLEEWGVEGRGVEGPGGFRAVAG